MLNADKTVFVKVLSGEAHVLYVNDRPTVSTKSLQSLERMLNCLYGQAVRTGKMVEVTRVWVDPRVYHGTK